MLVLGRDGTGLKVTQQLKASPSSALVAACCGMVSDGSEEIPVGPSNRFFARDSIVPMWLKNSTIKVPCFLVFLVPFVVVSELSAAITMLLAFMQHPSCACLRVT